jgi:hypothetical protein
MDEMELLVVETFKHFHENHSSLVAPKENSARKKDHFTDYPDKPGIIYHVQKSSSVFVIRTLVSKNIRHDLPLVVERPEDYPSLRLLEGGNRSISSLVKFFIVDDSSQAEVIHDQLHNRRFPVFEEMMCNLSDPGFSWWLTKKSHGFGLSFTMSVAAGPGTLKIGPLGDREMALRNFQEFERLVTSAGIRMNVQNETNRVQFTDSEEFILEELKDVFEFGVINQTLRDLFKILARKCSNSSTLEQIWFYLEEVAAVRRFWIQIQYDIND